MLEKYFPCERGNYWGKKKGRMVLNSLRLSYVIFWLPTLVLWFDFFSGVGVVTDLDPGPSVDNLHRCLTTFKAPACSAVAPKQRRLCPCVFQWPDVHRKLAQFCHPEGQSWVLVWNPVILPTTRKRGQPKNLQWPWCVLWAVLAHRDVNEGKQHLPPQPSSAEKIRLLPLIPTATLLNSRENWFAEHSQYAVRSIFFQILKFFWHRWGLEYATCRFIAVCFIEHLNGKLDQQMNSWPAQTSIYSINRWTSNSIQNWQNCCFRTIKQPM